MTFQQDKHVTPVLFRRYKDGSVIALFPTNPGTNNPSDCASYMHVGQHASAFPHCVIKETKPAEPAEYMNLKAELEGATYGYKLFVVRRLRLSFALDRLAELKRQRVPK